MRVHLHDVLSDLLLTDRHSARSWPLPKSMARIADEGGVLVILGAEAHGAELLARVKGFEAADKGLAPEGPSGRAPRAGSASVPRSSRRWASARCAC